MGWQAWQVPAWWSGIGHEWLQPTSPLQAGVSLASNLTAEQLEASACCVIA